MLRAGSEMPALRVCRVPTSTKTSRGKAAGTRDLRQRARVAPGWRARRCRHVVRATCNAARASCRQGGRCRSIPSDADRPAHCCAVVGPALRPKSPTAGDGGRARDAPRRRRRPRRRRSARRDGGAVKAERRRRRARGRARCVPATPPRSAPSAPRCASARRSRSPSIAATVADAARRRRRRSATSAASADEPATFAVPISELSRSASSRAASTSPSRRPRSSSRRIARATRDRRLHRSRRDRAAPRRRARVGVARVVGARHGSPAMLNERLQILVDRPAPSPGARGRAPRDVVGGVIRERSMRSSAAASVRTAERPRRIRRRRAGATSTPRGAGSHRRRASATSWSRIGPRRRGDDLRRRQRDRLRGGRADYRDACVEPLAATSTAPMVDIGGGRSKRPGTSSARRRHGRGSGSRRCEPDLRAAAAGRTIGRREALGRRRDRTRASQAGTCPPRHRTIVTADRGFDDARDPARRAARADCGSAAVRLDGAVRERSRLAP